MHAKRYFYGDKIKTACLIIFQLVCVNIWFKVIDTEAIDENREISSKYIKTLHYQNSECCQLVCQVFAAW